MTDIINQLLLAMHAESAIHAPRTTEAIEAMRRAQGEIEHLRSEIDTIHRADATEIGHLRAEIERLLTALQPFADEAMCWMDHDDSEHLVENFPGYEGHVTVGDCRRARAALEAKNE